MKSRVSTWDEISFSRDELAELFINHAKAQEENRCMLNVATGAVEYCVKVGIPLARKSFWMRIVSLIALGAFVLTIFIANNSSQRDFVLALFGPLAASSFLISLWLRRGSKMYRAYFIQALRIFRDSGGDMKQIPDRFVLELDKV